MEKNTGNVFLSADKMAQSPCDECVKILPAVDLSVDMYCDGADISAGFSNVWEIFSSSYIFDAMRICGADEKYISGDASDYEKFRELCRVMPLLAGNGIYALAHTLLKSFFNCDLDINSDNCDKIWEITADRFFASDLTLSDLYSDIGGTVCINTDVLDDPCSISSINLRKDNLKIIPVFCPDSLFGIDKKSLPASISKLEELTGMHIRDLADLSAAISSRIDSFCSFGCRFASHLSVDIPIFTRPDPYHADQALKKAVSGKLSELKNEDVHLFKAQLCRMLTGEYKKRGMVLRLSCRGKATEDLLCYLAQSDVLCKTVIYVQNAFDPSLVSDTFLSIRKKCSFDADHLSYGIQISAKNFSDMEAILKNSAEALAFGAVSDITFSGPAPFICAARNRMRQSVCKIIGNSARDGYYTTDRDASLELTKRVLYENAVRVFEL